MPGGLSGGWAGFSTKSDTPCPASGDGGGAGATLNLPSEILIMLQVIDTVPVPLANAIAVRPVRP